jgi:hypothetical protein
MEITELLNRIQANIEWLETTEGDEIECIGIENLEVILSDFLDYRIKLTLDE